MAGPPGWRSRPTAPGSPRAGTASPCGTSAGTAPRSSSPGERGRRARRSASDGRHGLHQDLRRAHPGVGPRRRPAVPGLKPGDLARVGAAPSRRVSPGPQQGRLRRRSGRSSGCATSPPARWVREVAPDLKQRNYVDLAWHPDSTTLNITTGGPVVRTWDAATGRQLAEHRLGPSARGRRRHRVLQRRRQVPARGHHDGAAARPRRPDAGASTGADPGARAKPGQAEETGARSSFVAQRRRPHGLRGRRHRRLPRPGRCDRCPTSAPGPARGPPSPDGPACWSATPTGASACSTRRRWSGSSRPNAAQAGLVGLLRPASATTAPWSRASTSGRLSHWDGVTGAYLGTRTVDEDGAPAFCDDNTAAALRRLPSGTVLRWDPRPELVAQGRLPPRRPRPHPAGVAQLPAGPPVRSLSARPDRGR